MGKCSSSEQKRQLPYKFSQTIKGPNIVVYQKGKFCQKKNSLGHQNVIVENSIARQKQKISFHVERLKTWISLGLGQLSQLKADNYISYGDNVSYSISTARQVYQLNKMATVHNINIQAGDIIEVNLIEGMIIFAKKGEETSAVVMQVKFTEQQWRQACFFVNLCSQGDCVEIVS